jgi:hypothetical protein
MARGWESKDVEAQVVESAEPRKFSSGHSEMTPAQQLREQSIKDLQLSKTRINNDLSNATNPHHRKSLEAALAHLEKKISELG